jgi:hypothetical protein
MIALVLAVAMQTANPRIVDQGARGSIQTRRDVVVRTQAEWDALMPSLRGDQPKAVDFSKEMIVGVFLGSRPTPGYGVTIVSADEENGVLHVKYRETAPQPGMIAAQVITYPYQVVAIQKSAAKDVKFEKVE